jgi:hypothetical protein
VAGIEFTLPPLGKANFQEPGEAPAQEIGPHPGWYAISVGLLRGCEFGVPDGKGGYCGAPLNAFSYFQRFKPVTHIGWSIYVYQIEENECARVRRDMGLPPLRPTPAP